MAAQVFKKSFEYFDLRNSPLHVVPFETPDITAVVVTGEGCRACTGNSSLMTSLN